MKHEYSARADGKKGIFKSLLHTRSALPGGSCGTIHLVHGFVSLIDRELAVGNGEGEGHHGGAVDAAGLAAGVPRAVLVLLAEISVIHPCGMLRPVAAADLEHALGVVIVSVKLELIAGKRAEGF
jgi:hypothetical protein